MTVVLLGLPTNSLGTRDGVARAPHAPRKAGLGATVTIYNPDLDPDGRHAPAIVDLIVSVAAALASNGRGG